MILKTYHGFDKLNLVRVMYFGFRPEQILTTVPAASKMTLVSKVVISI